MLIAQFRSPAEARAAIGSTVGAFIGVERGVGMSEGWEQTFHEPRTMAVPVEVHPTSAAETATARRSSKTTGHSRFANHQE